MIVEPLDIIDTFLIIAARMTCAKHAKNGIEIYLTDSCQLKEEVEGVIPSTKCH